MSFKAKVKDQNIGQIDTKLTNVKLLECPFIDDCILKERISCNLYEFPNFLNCTEYQPKKAHLFRDLKEYVIIKDVKKRYIREIISNVISVHQDNIEKKSGLFKEVYFELALKYLKKISHEMIIKLKKSEDYLDSIDALLEKAFMHFKEKSKIGQRFSQYSISLASVSIFVMFILKEEDFKFKTTDKFIKTISSLSNIEFQISNFKSSLQLIFKIIKSKKFLEVISFISKHEIFPFVRNKLDIPSDKAPLLLDICPFFPIYCSILWKRPYKYGHKPVYYDDIISELGYKRTDKASSGYFPFIGGDIPKPVIANLEKLAQYDDLKKHLTNVYENGGFPENIIKAIVDKRNAGIFLPRISKFKITGVRYKQRLEFEKNFVRSPKQFQEGDLRLEDGYIKEIRSGNIYSYYADPEHYNENEILGHGQPDHIYCLINLLKNDSDSVGIEVPVWFKYLDSFITGHIDLLRVSDMIQVVDYKPTSFFHSIPQIAVYGLVVMKEYRVNDLNCVIFNKDKVWIFKPKPVLSRILSFLDSLDIKLFWYPYVEYLFKNT